MTAADLTPAERDILERLLSGKTTVEIATSTGEAQSTLGHRVMQLKIRVGVRTLMQLGYWAALHGIHPVNVGAGGERP